MSNIKSIFPTNILIKDLEISESDEKDLDLVVKTVMASFIAESGITQVEAGENHLPLFTEENIERFPVLEKVREHFIDGFSELAESYNSSDVFNKNKIKQLVNKYTGRLPFMEEGNYKDTHSHPGCIAFGILYLSNVDNNKDGGILKLFDPSWSNTIGFSNDPIHEIETKKHRLIIAPAHVWHSVSPYNGKETRATIVINLDLTPLYEYS
jgi:hypothetical protein